MIMNEQCARAYKLHSKHLERDVQFVGEAENVEEILNIAKEIRPNVYMLAESCVTGEPSIQLATWKVVRRIGLRHIPPDERERLLTSLEKGGVEYRQTRYLCLNRDFSMTLKGKFQKPLKKLYDLYSNLFH